MEQIEDRGRLYRRGMILGWTLAEVFLLVVFILLLLFGQMVRKEANDKDLQIKLAIASQQLREEKQANAALQIETGVRAITESCGSGAGMKKAAYPSA
jgi:hypothetical protein